MRQGKDNYRKAEIDLDDGAIILRDQIRPHIHESLRRSGTGGKSRGMGTIEERAWFAAAAPKWSAGAVKLSSLSSLCRN